MVPGKIGADRSVDLLIYPIGELATPHLDVLPAHGSDMSKVQRIKDAAIAVSNGVVLAAGSAESVLAKFPPAAGTKVVEAAGKLVTPGLVDPHTHLIFAGNRADEFIMRCQGKSYQEIARAGGGIVASIRPTREATVDQLVAIGRQRLDRMLHAGTTTCEVKTGYGLDLASELRMLEAIIELSTQQPVTLVPTFMPAHAVPPGLDQTEYVQQIISEMLPRAAAMYAQRAAGATQQLFVDVFCDEGYFTLAQTRAILEAGARSGMRPKVHSDEFASLGATRVAVELKAASADHLLSVSDEDIQLLAQSDTIAVLLPGTSFYLTLSEHAPARKLIEAGAAVALGSDFNPGSCHIFSLPLIWALACMHLKMSPEEALTALTANAAFALGYGSTIGQIRTGYQADIVIFDVGSLEEIAYNVGWNPVLTTFKGGVVAAENKK